VSETPAPSARARSLREELFAEDLTASEVAHILDLDESTVRRRLGDGTLPGYRLGREWRITEQALRAYVAQLKRNHSALPHSGTGPGTIRWPAGSTVPSITHPIGATVTYNASGLVAEHDEP
jgi:excisionase family DNA binding protein